MKEELSNAFGELNGLIFKGLKENNSDCKMVHAMNITLQLAQIRMMLEKRGVLSVS
jgi:hypothetical protein